MKKFSSWIVFVSFVSSVSGFAQQQPVPLQPTQLLVCPVGTVPGCVPAPAPTASPATRTVVRPAVAVPQAGAPISISVNVTAPPAPAQSSMSPEMMAMMMKMLQAPPTGTTSDIAIVEFLRQNADKDADFRRQMLEVARGQAASARVANKWLALSGIANSVSAVTGVMTVQRLGKLNKSAYKQAESAKIMEAVTLSKPLQVIQSVTQDVDVKGVSSSEANAQGGQGGGGGSVGAGGITASATGGSATNTNNNEGGDNTANGGQATGNGGQATGNGGQATGNGGQATGGNGGNGGQVTVPTPPAPPVLHNDHKGDKGGNDHDGHDDHSDHGGKK